ncbi:MAG: hypothetical protein O7E52_14265 [Candidatus Poribacteria bacterium]|nr:hypothetical protein [Candidatus Poribacteria bacterium]
MDKVFLAIYCLMAPLAARADGPLEHDVSQAFVEILKDEYHNRSFAYLVSGRMAKNSSHAEIKRYWVQFFELEKHNRQIYIQNAAAFSMDPEPGVWNHLRAYAVSVFLRLASETTMTKLLENTKEYIPRLERMREIGPVFHREFLDYVVAQESVIAESAKHYLNKDFDRAESVIEVFLSQQER